MSDRVLIPLANGSALALTLDQYRVALAEGAKLVASPAASPAATAPVANLMTADELGELAHVSRTTIYELAKAGTIPCVRIGRRVRFDRAQALAALRTTDKASLGHA